MEKIFNDFKSVMDNAAVEYATKYVISCVYEPYENGDFLQADCCSIAEVVDDAVCNLMVDFDTYSAAEIGMNSLDYETFCALDEDGENVCEYLDCQIREEVEKLMTEAIKYCKVDFNANITINNIFMYVDSIENNYDDLLYAIGDIINTNIWDDEIEEELIFEWVEENKSIIIQKYSECVA